MNTVKKIDAHLIEPDAAESGDALVPAFIPEDAPIVTDLPTFVDTENIRSLYGWKPGESLDEAIARKKAQEG